MRLLFTPYLFDMVYLAISCLIGLFNPSCNIIIVYLEIFGRLIYISNLFIVVNHIHFELM